MGKTTNKNTNAEKSARTIITQLSPIKCQLPHLTYIKKKCKWSVQVQKYYNTIF